MVPELRPGVRAYISSVTHEPSDHCVHLVKEIGRQTVLFMCRLSAVPFDSSLKRYPRALPTTDPLTCMVCIAEDV